MTPQIFKRSPIGTSQEETPKYRLSLKERWARAKIFAKRCRLNLAVAVALALWFQTVLFGWGTSEYTDWRTGNDPVSAVGCSVVLAFIFLRLSLSRVWKWTLAIIAVILAFLSPFYAMTGTRLVSGQTIDTLLGTNTEEVHGLIASLPLSAWDIGAAGALVIAFLLRFTLTERSAVAKYGTPILSPDKMKFWTVVSFGLLLTIPGMSPILDVGSGFLKIESLKHTTPVSAWAVTGKLETAPLAVKEKEPIKNYVIVMSESLSEKTMGLYGAPFNTTPFLSSVPSKRLKTMVSASMATAAAVSLFTTRENPDDPLTSHFEDNIVTLAKKAGLKTYWVSAQGRTSAFEALISFIADQADSASFVSKHDDLGLLPTIGQILSKPEADRQGRLIFVHTYGAHERTCDRVKDIGRPFKTGAEPFLDCYLAAAYKQDLLVKGIVERLNGAGEPWSLIFTSDHAINMRRKDDGTLVAMRNSGYKGQFEVPFVQIGQGITRSEVFDRVRSARAFRDYFPAWIGVTTNQTPDGYDIFTAPSDSDITVIRTDGTRQNYGELKPSPTISEIIASGPGK